jgi:hypothetical protein
MRYIRVCMPLSLRFCTHGMHGQCRIVANSNIWLGTFYINSIFHAATYWHLRNILNMNISGCTPVKVLIRCSVSTGFMKIYSQWSSSSWIRWHTIEVQVQKKCFESHLQAVCMSNSPCVVHVLLGTGPRFKFSTRMQSQCPTFALNLTLSITAFRGPAGRACDMGWRRSTPADTYQSGVNRLCWLWSAEVDRPEPR